MRHSCGKFVQKSVENYVKKCVQKLCKLIVQKWQTINKIVRKISFTQAKVDFKQVFAIFYHNFHTQFLFNSPLLSESFAPFAHRTINTTITFNNKEEINF